MSPTDFARRNPTALALGAATVMIAQQVAGKAARDGLFLSHFDVSELPKAVIAGALVSLGAVFAMAHALTRFGPARAVPAAFAISAGLFFVERLMLDAAPGPTAVLLYLHMSSFGAMLISGFWSMVNERFDPHAAKARIARIAAGAALGGVVGGLLAHSVSDSLGFPSMLVLLAILNIVCALVLRPFGSVLPEPAQTGGSQVRSGLAMVSHTPYLRHMATLLVLMALTAALVDFAFKAQAAEHFGSRENLVAFFATFYAVAGVISFLLQSVLGPRVLVRFGIGPALAALPLLTMVGGALATLAMGVAGTAALRGGYAVISNSLFRSSFELLYAPLPAHAKRPTKTIIDVASDRIGDVLGGGLVLALIAVAPQAPARVTVSIGVLTAAAAFVLAIRLTRGYVDQLARTLRSGSLSLVEDDVLDATTRRVLAETSAGAERAKVLERIKELRRDREQGRPRPPDAIFGGAPDRPIAAGDGQAAQDTPAPGRDGSQRRLAAAVAELCSGDRERVRRALLGEFMDVRLVPLLIPLLDDPHHAEDAHMELRWLVPRVIGQLTDALLDPDLPLTVRQRIPAVMEICHNPRVVTGLIAGLADEEFSVRYASARALARMRSRDPSLAVPEEVAYDAVRREVSVAGEVWSTRSLGEEDAHLGGTQGDGNEGGTLSLDHVFTLLGLVLDRDALKLALQALGSDNRNLRGTALEYLDNVLPDDLRRRLWRHLGVTVTRRPTPPSPRASQTGETR